MKIIKIEEIIEMITQLAYPQASLKTNIVS